MVKEFKKNSVSTKHPDYSSFSKSWTKIRDCLAGEDVVKSKKEEYLPRPKGMSGEYKDAYDAYIERAHFPLITAYALQGALGVVVTKLPDFNVPKELEYIIENATKDGKSLPQLFLDIVIEIFQTGRVPILVDIVEENEFRFVQYKSEELINWKSSNEESENSLMLAVISEYVDATDDIFSHETNERYRVFSYDEKGNYISRVFGDDLEYTELKKTPTFMGNTLDEIPLMMAGSINNSFNIQPIPLISVANCSVQIYRKEADLANSEFLSCNPTLVITGASNDSELPNVVGSSVMIVLENEQANVKYTTTDTAALTHVKDHIKDLYEEAIRHGVSILDTRNGVESAESLRIRQSTQSATIYSIYLAAVNALNHGLKLMCKWAGYNIDEVKIDAPNSLTYGIPDPAVIKQIVEGFGQGVVPMTVIHKYLVSSGLLDQTISYEDYIDMLKKQNDIKDKDTSKNSSNKNNEDDNENEE